MFWTRFLQAGSKTESATRIKDSIVGVGNPVAPLYTLRKDYKVHDDESPPVRPGAVAGCNHRLGVHDQYYTSRSVEIERGWCRK